jgi:uncharacterized protein (DUF488 family)
MESNFTRTPRIFTIGHSNHTADHFLSLLKSHAVQVVVDVRSQPYSKYSKQFDHEAIKRTLPNAGIRYLYLGRELGGRPEGEEFYDGEGHVIYSRLATTKLFQDALLRLERGILEYKIALLCAEENPAMCHRRLLVSRVLAEHGVQAEHIRGDGRIQTEEEVAAEAEPDGGQASLFRTKERDSWKSASPILRKKAGAR